jgi:ABC-type maltose transport system permease subunit
LVVALILLATSAAYSLAAVMRTFDSIEPNNATRIIAHTVEDEALVDGDRLATVLAAQRRTSIVADWKLARLKVAALAYAAGVIFVVLASVAFIASTSL